MTFPCNKGERFRMKNKSKLKKIKENKSDVVKLPSQWLFVAREEVTARDVKNALDDCADVELEIWEAVGVVEVVLSDGKSIDFEQTEADLHDEYSNEFLARQQAKALFYVTIHPDSIQLAAPVMKHLLNKIDGMFCGDTDDFYPQVTLNAEETK